MRRIIVSLAAVALIVIALSCASDIYLEELESLSGDYTGWYIVTKQSEPPVEYKQTIKWQFRGGSYHMSVDTAAPGFDDQLCICKVFGSYEVTNKVELTQAGEDIEEHYGCHTCIQSFNPQGAFGVERSADTLILRRTDTVPDPDLLKEIKLLRSSGQ